jgi:hypothetical protein
MCGSEARSPGRPRGAVSNEHGVPIVPRQRRLSPVRRLSMSTGFPNSHFELAACRFAGVVDQRHMIAAVGAGGRARPPEAGRGNAVVPLTRTVTIWKRFTGILTSRPVIGNACRFSSIAVQIQAASTRRTGNRTLTSPDSPATSNNRRIVPWPSSAVFQLTSL